MLEIYAYIEYGEVDTVTYVKTSMNKYNIKLPKYIIDIINKQYTDINLYIWGSGHN